MKLHLTAVLVSLEGSRARRGIIDILPKSYEPLRILTQARNYLRGRAVGIADGKRIPDGLKSWDDKGRYILPNAIHEEVVRNLYQFETTFNDACANLLADVAASGGGGKLLNQPGRLSSTAVALLYIFNTKLELIEDQHEVTP